MKPAISKCIAHNLTNAFFETKRGKRFFEELLSPPEKIQLAKRLAIIVMLERGNSSYEISQALKVSVATVLTQRRLMLSGRYDELRSAMASGRTSKRTLPDIIELLLAAGMPSIAGPRHQKRLQKLRSG